MRHRDLHDLGAQALIDCQCAADRLLYYLCEWQGYDREQVAVRIGVRRGTLNARLRRIRERLRRVLRAGGWGPAVAEVGHE